MHSQIDIKEELDMQAFNDAVIGEVRWAVTIGCKVRLWNVLLDEK